ncbi:hypothetical protein HPB49_026528 [Dermacentor silvarum]|nr:hypothetical protein HPB49_026528 [Dermacentor silvarum]
MGAIVKSVDLVSAYITRIREVQPIINAVVEERFEEALQDAKEADRLVASGSMSATEMTKEKPLLGLPFTAKNSIAIKGLRQDAGSLFWHGRRAEEDAPSVALLPGSRSLSIGADQLYQSCACGATLRTWWTAARGTHTTRAEAPVEAAVRTSSASIHPLGKKRGLDDAFGRQQRSSHFEEYLENVAPSPDMLC